MTLWLVLHNPDRQSEQKEKRKDYCKDGGSGEWGSAAGPAGLSPGGACMCAFDFWPT